jgi:hypothetical protein
MRRIGLMQWTQATAAVLALSAWGCSGGDSDGKAANGGTGGGTSAAGASAAGASVGGSTAGGAGGTGTGGKPVDMTVVAPTTPTARTEGSLRARLLFERGSSAWNVHAAFDSPAGFGEYGFACHLSVFEGCELEDCGFPEGDVDGTFLHPGALTLTNQTSNQMTVLEPAPKAGGTAQDVYPQLTAAKLQLNPGDMLHISAAGTADVPAFEATLKVPAELAAATATTAPQSVSKNTFMGKNGLGFGWTSSEELVLVRFSYGPYGFSGFDPSFNATAYCAYPGASGMAGLSPSVIEKTGCASNNVAILSAYAEQQVQAGSYTVVVALQDPSNVSGYLNCQK